jgi:glucokinase
VPTSYGNDDGVSKDQFWKRCYQLSSGCMNLNCFGFLNICSSAYGCEAGSAAIKFIPTGGLFVTGGLTPKNIKFIEGQDSPFMKAYNDKGRVKPILEYVPCFAVKTEDLGVRGAHKCALMVR